MSDKPPIARRMADIQPFHVMQILAHARALEAQGRRIIHMEVGEPDFPTPEPIIHAGQRALAQGRTHYTPAVGLQALREAIAAHYAERFSLDISPQRIIVTPGASGALQLALAVLVNPGDEVVMADPGYPCNRHFVRLLEGKAVLAETGPQTAYQLTQAHLSAHWTHQTCAALLASPSNPTGTLIGPESMRALYAFVQQRGACLIVDEIYQGLVYDQEPVSALSVADDIFVVNSFSKYFGMTGWRLGWLVAPQAYVPALDRLAQNIFLAASTPAQYAALAAFEPDTLAILEQRRMQFKQRRDYLLPALRDLGFDIPVTPQGAFYLYANCQAFSEDSEAFCKRLLEQAGVGITPGLDFGHYQAAAHLRFAYTTELDALQEGVARIRRFLA